MDLTAHPCRVLECSPNLLRGAIRAYWHVTQYHGSILKTKGIFDQRFT